MKPHVSFRAKARSAGVEKSRRSAALRIRDASRPDVSTSLASLLLLGMTNGFRQNRIAGAVGCASEMRNNNVGIISHGDVVYAGFAGYALFLRVCSQFGARLHRANEIDRAAQCHRFLIA